MSEAASGVAASASSKNPIPITALAVTEACSIAPQLVHGDVEESVEMSRQDYARLVAAAAYEARSRRPQRERGGRRCGAPHPRGPPRTLRPRY